MDLAGFSAGEWLLLVQYELLLFASLFFFIGALDEFAIDCVWLWLKLTGRIPTGRLDAGVRGEELNGSAAIFVPAWREHFVIGDTLRHARKVWPQRAAVFFIGCYRNDAETIATVLAASGHDPRVRLVVHDAVGPTTKADCLNRLYRALCTEERRTTSCFRMVMLHDAEDMVDPDALPILDAALSEADFVQLPVLPVASPKSRWIGSHYCEEFAEAHGKGMVVRDALNAGLPSAGVGCAIARDQLALLARNRGGGQPFDAAALTEDYQLGLSIAQDGGRTRFLRVRNAEGQLVATRSYFPSDIGAAVRQKTRWLHGIAFQGWDQLGWSASPVESWMRLRDRRGPFAAFVLAVAYILVVVAGVTILAASFGLVPPIALTPLLWWLLILNLISVVWRACFRFAFTTREYGFAEGIRAVLRIPVANVISIMAGRRAFMAYVRSLAGRAPSWDKTDHLQHPAKLALQGSERG